MDLEWKSLIVTKDSVPNENVANQSFYSDKCDWISRDSLTSLWALSHYKVFSQVDKETWTYLVSYAIVELFDNHKDASSHFEELVALSAPSLRKDFNDEKIENILIHLLTATKVQVELNKLNLNIRTFTDIMATSGTQAIEEIDKSGYNVIVNKESEVDNLWNPYQAVDIIQKELVKTKILPDVSSLNFNDIAELKDKLKTDFDPFRSELLTMTEALRAMVKDDLSEENISREAANLIKTRVEPVLRNYAAIVDSELKDKYKKYLKKGVRVLGFAGLGLVYPKALAWVMNDTIDLAAEGLSENMDIKPASETAKFAIKMDSYLKK